MKRLGAFASAIFLAASVQVAPTTAPAADLDVAVVRRAPPEIVVVAPLHVWMGHFSGGRNLAPGVEPTALDWVDTTERFASVRDCAAWLRALTRVYHRYQGYKTCLLIR